MVWHRAADFLGTLVREFCLVKIVRISSFMYFDIPSEIDVVRTKTSLKYHLFNGWLPL